MSCPEDFARHALFRDVRPLRAALGCATTKTVAVDSGLLPLLLVALFLSSVCYWLRRLPPVSRDRGGAGRGLSRDVGSRPVRPPTRSKIREVISRNAINLIRRCGWYPPQNPGECTLPHDRLNVGLRVHPPEGWCDYPLDRDELRLTSDKGARSD